ncbi:uncharacterized protein [Typha latifolia]|uniref:uncharacterized protein isoform X2 n=1 Tax=Typha latifolia TaxID=4733 RepID=UPI003C30C283
MKHFKITLPLFLPLLHQKTTQSLPGLALFYRCFFRSRLALRQMSSWPSGTPTSPPPDSASTAAAGEDASEKSLLPSLKEEVDDSKTDRAQEIKPGSVDDFSETDIIEHEEKLNMYEAMYARRLKAKYFSNKTFTGGDIFEQKVHVQDQTIKSSRWPCTRSFADPAKYLQEQNQSPSLAAETSVTPTKKQASKKSS